MYLHPANTVSFLKRNLRGDMKILRLIRFEDKIGVKPVILAVLMWLIFLIRPQPLGAQSYYFRHYQVENGLSNNTVFCTVQDKLGFIWMGTKDGLNRFDGYSFKVFKNQPDDSGSIGDNFIRSLFIDDANNLYAGTRNGVYRFFVEQEKFVLVYATSYEVRDIEKDSRGNLWLVAGQQLIRYNETRREQKTYHPENFFAATSLCIDSSKNLWISTANGLLKKYDPATDGFISYDLFSERKISSPRWIEKIYATSSGSILAGTSNYGVKLFDINSHHTKDLLTYNPDKTEIFARDFVQNNESEIWIATESGIFIYNTSKGSFSNLKKEYNNSYSISDNAVYSLCKDREGGIWAGTYFGGANYFPRQYTSFEKYFPGYTSAELSGNAVREICEDKFGNLWIGTEDAGLNKLNRQTGLFEKYLPTGTSSGISYPNIHGLLARDEELWIGTFEHGLNIMDIRTGKVIRTFPGRRDSGVMRSNFIVTIYQTKQGEVYIGTRRGLYRYKPATQSFEAIDEIPADCFVHSMVQDGKGLLWIGTMGNGLFCYDPVSRNSKNFLSKLNDKNSLCSNSVTIVFEDSEGKLWIGTEGGGLCSFNRDDNSFAHYPAKEGLPGSTVYKILEDGNKNLWITTSKGLVSFHLGSREQKVYTTANGLLSDQFNYNSGYKDADGRMYFGSVKGMISFNPGTFSTNTFIPPLYITSLQVNNRELAVNREQSPLKKSILFTEALELSYDQASFSIDFAALSFTAPEMNQYKYIMEGVDREWTSLKTNRKVYFTNLAPGEYTFKVKAANSSGVWNEKEAKLVIRILPPWWASTIAYVFYFLIAALLAYILFKSYHDRVAEKNRRRIEFLEHEKEKEIYQSKIDFFTNIAHEIRTPLTLIKAPLEKVVERAGESKELGHHLKIMETNTERLIELTNQLLDFRKVESNNLQVNFVYSNINELLTERYISFKTIADQKNMRLSIQFPDSIVMGWVDIDSLHKILNNLFYNALTYGKKLVSVKLVNEEKNGDFFSIEFSNDGLLIPEEMREKIFEPFYRLKENRTKPGSGIGLALARSLAQLHKGELFVKATNDGLNTFVLRLPLFQQTGEST